MRVGPVGPRSGSRSHSCLEDMLCKVRFLLRELLAHAGARLAWAEYRHVLVLGLRIVLGQFWDSSIWLENGPASYCVFRHPCMD